MRTTVIQGVPYYTIERRVFSIPRYHDLQEVFLVRCYLGTETPQTIRFYQFLLSPKRTNNDMLTGFVLYAFRVCSVEILEEEIFSFIF